MVHSTSVPLHTLTFEKPKLSEGDPNLVPLGAGSSHSSCLSPSMLIGESISTTVFSSSVTARLCLCRLDMYKSVGPTDGESCGGGVGC